MIQGWNDEQIKVILSFDNGRTYESKTHAGDSNSIVSFIKNEVEQVNYSNMFGSVNSNEITLTLFDISDRLNCENKQSPYYNYMRYGVKIEAFISYDDGVNWEEYGTYYVTSWSGVFSDGFQEVVKISATDEMKYILNSDMPELSTYSGIKAVDLIRTVLTKLGIDNNRIKISKELDTELRFGIQEDEKVGYFLNDICQALCAVIIINDVNEILVMPALAGYSNEYYLDTKYIEKVTNKNNNKSIYTTVKCKYKKRKGTKYGELLNTVSEVNAGVKDIKRIEFNERAINIKELRFETNDNNISINGFSAYQNGIDIDLASIDKLENVSITVSGDYITSAESYVRSQIMYADKKRICSYEMYNDYVQTEKEAQIIADKMAKYIELMDRQIVLKTYYTSRITLGDIINFDDELLQGQYKVIASRTVHGSTYVKELTLIPYDILGVWDDSKSWNDNANWIENIDLSLS